MPRLRITEIFHSLQGETRTVGLPTVFIRLTGCPLRCQYCDTAYAFTGGTYHTVSEIIDQVAQYQAEYVTVTGGEPLAQQDCHALLAALCDLGYQVSLETSGHIPLDGVDHRVVKVMDIKTPGSNECAQNHWMNLNYLQAQDQIKFVICHREDYDWAKQILSEQKLNQVCDVLFSPSYGQQNQQELANWILEDRLPVRFQIQLHKVIWGDVPGK
jgi:7-carboxy-7-deazaguanine synthase